MHIVRKLPIRKPVAPGQQFICRACLQRAFAQRLSRSFSSYAAQRYAPEPRTKAEEVVPFRKQLKDEAKRQKRQGIPNKSKGNTSEVLLDKWELTVGIEIHAELNTAKKLFSSAATSINDVPNAHVALFDAAIPGSQPKFQKETLIPALRAALALNCDIQQRSTFDRKHYFYQDQPSGYQITQYYESFAKSGHLTLHAHDGIDPTDHPSIQIPIKQIQMEQDTAKTLHQPPATNLLDYNRVSHPLIEIITEPSFHHPATAAAFVRKVQRILSAVDACVVGMEMGGLRADVNVSVRKRPAEGQNAGPLGQRTEIKNLSSFKAVEDAIVAERDRQIGVLEQGGVIEGETRGWSLGRTSTRRLRGKEGEVDYRYMPDPDLAPVIIGKDLLEHLIQTKPELPDELLIARLQEKPYELSTADAMVLIDLDAGDRLDFYMDVVAALQSVLSPEMFRNAKVGRMVGNWVLHEIGGLLTTSTREWHDQPVHAQHLIDLISHLVRRDITSSSAKQIVAAIFNGDERSVSSIIEDEGLFLRRMSDDQYIELAKELMKENPDMVRAVTEKHQKGKLMWFVGQMMRRGEQGSVEADVAAKHLKSLMGLDDSMRGKDNLQSVASR
ncbi:MAG: hypothetical protein M1820_007609 [Bogoriella megaspora]|nr:MAG: hypothetical protein M1820_007609 [Bogoriella megaspora]